MADMMEYKCPSCGGAMEFDSTTQKMKCPYCDTEMEVAQYQQMQEKAEGNAGGNPGGDTGGNNENWSDMGNNQWMEGEADGIRVYACQSCGGEIVADANTGATSCPFCGNRVVMKGQFAGDLKPDYIIPFKKDKKAAKAAYFNHLKGKKYLPKVFKKENHVDEMKGVYVPFWIFDVDAEGSVAYNGERITKWRNGDTEYTKTEMYSMQRGGNLSFARVPADGSRKMDDTLMESIEPFEFREAVPFQAAYLAGYMADRHDMDMEERMERARERVKKATEDAFRKTLPHMDRVTVASSNVNVCNARYWYVLYPVWVLNTTWNGEKFTFAMNGQSGKLVGNLPMDKKQCRIGVSVRGGIIGLVIYLLLWIIALM